MFVLATVVRRNERVSVDTVNLQDTRLRIVLVIRSRDFFHAVYNLSNFLSLLGRINNGDILDDIVRFIQRASLVQLQVRQRIVDVAFLDGCIDVVSPHLVVQEVIAVRKELLIGNLELGR